MSLDFSLYVHTLTYDGNMTHNVSRMWREAGCYDALYESHGMTARDLVPFLERGLAMMRSDPDKFRKLNPENGWGDYETAVQFLRNVLNACRENPEATVGISR